MGKKNKEKVKEKKAAHKAHLAQLSASQSRVAAANALQDPLAPFSIFHKYDKNSIQVSVTCHPVAALDPATMEWVFDLTKRNMETLYETSDWGWRDKDKREELGEESAWYLICKDHDGNNVAFVHFRFDLEDDVEVLYLYEIQMEKQIRRKGLGRFLVTALTLMAKKYEMEKVCCTVFQHNHDSMSFFKDTCRFEVDETSPDAMIDLDEPVCYQILCKRVRPAASSTAAVTSSAVSTNSIATATS